MKRFASAHLLLMLCIAGCGSIAGEPQAKPTANTSKPQLSPATSQAAEDPDAGRPAWVKVYNMPRQVRVIDETGRPIPRAAVHLKSANLDYHPDQLTGNDGTVLLPKPFYIDPPQWVSVQHDGYDLAEVAYPPRWPLQVTLHKAAK
jgi:hypothetical protein